MSDLETLLSMFMDVESTQTIWNKSTLKFAIILVSTYKWLIVDIGNSDLNGPRHQAWCESSKFITTASGGEGGQHRANRVSNLIEIIFLKSCSERMIVHSKLRISTSIISLTL